MPQGDLDLNTQTVSRNLDAILQKLDQVLQKVRQINSQGLQLGGGAGTGIGGLASGVPSGSTSLAIASGAGAAAGQPGAVSVPQTDAVSQQLLNRNFNMRVGAVGAVGLGGASYANYQSGQVLNGGADPIGRNLMVAGIASGIMGGIATAFGGPVLGASVGAFANATLGATGRFFGANEQNAIDVRRSIAGVLGTPNALGPLASSLDVHFAMLGGNGMSNQMPQWMQFSSAQAGQTWATVATAMMGGGNNPFAPGVGANYGGGELSFARAGHNLGRGSLGGWLNGAIQTRMGAIERMFGRKETISETYARRLDARYGKDAEGIAKEIAPIFGSSPETGENTADILNRFGALNTRRYLETVHGESPVAEGALLTASYGMRSGEREAQLGALQARGSGAAAAKGYRATQAAAAALPGGSDSLAYATAGAKARGAEAAAFEQEGVTAFGIPMLHLQGALDRADVLPFSGANQMSLQLSRITLDKKEVGRIRSYMARRRQAGDLSEDEEQQLTGQEEALRTDAARGVASLSLGMENRLPAMVAGRPLSFRGDSPMLAAMRLQRSPVRLYGAINGSQAQDQDSFLNGADMSTTPFSRTAGLNQGGGSQEMVSVLREIRDLLAGGSRRSQAGGQGGGQPRPDDMSQSGIYGRAN